MSRVRQIKSLTHPTVKHLVRLRKERSYRVEQSRALVLGQKLVAELRPYAREIFSAEPAPETTLVTYEILKKVAGVPAPDQVVAEVDLPQPTDLRSAKKILICDHIQDPGNLGTLIRTALAFGFDGCMLLSGCVDLFNDKVIRASKGACLKLPYSFQSLDELPHTLYHGDIKGTPINEIKPKTPFGLIVSNEGQGPSDATIAQSTPVTIPMSAMTESLNVAVAGSIMMHHFCEVTQ